MVHLKAYDMPWLLKSDRKAYLRPWLTQMDHSVSFVRGITFFVVIREIIVDTYVTDLDFSNYPT